MALAALRKCVEDARAAGGEALALALVELAEAEPVLAHRQAAVRQVLEEAATHLDKVQAPALEGRVLLRLGQLKLSEGDLEGTEQLATRAQDRLDATSDPWRVLECRTLLARSAIRRDNLARAEELLVELGQRSEEPETLPARRAVAGLTLAWSELALEQRQYSDAEERLALLASGIDDDEDLVEYRYACKQARALVALALGKNEKACQLLRDLVGLAKSIGSVEDELETRIALAGALTERGDVIGRDEAEKHLQITRDLAQEHDLDSLHMAALVGQAGLLAKKGQTQAALDRCLEIANAAVAKKDLPRYGAAVALMSQIYEQKGDLASAYRTLAEASVALTEQLGDAARNVIRPHLVAFADRIGRDKFREVAERVTAAANARAGFRRL